MSDHDLIVIGGGAGGMGVADAALRRGADVAIVQDGPMGGDCTWTGCVPSKALIAAAARGLGPERGFAEAKRAIRQVAAQETADVFRARGVTVHEGRARFLTRRTLDVGGRRLTADRIVIATGAAPLVPPIDGLHEAAPLTSDSLWNLDELPPSLAVLGGGPIGTELAQACNRLGVRVTLLEGMDQILGREEPETADLLTRILRDEGVDVRLGELVSQVERLDDGRAVVRTPSGDPVTADDVLVAVGRRPVTEGLNPEIAGVRVDDDGFVLTDSRMATTAPGVYAVGDVTGVFPFTHGAYAQGMVAVSHALGRFSLRRFSTAVQPVVTFTDPEIARVGMTEAEAFDSWGGDARVVELPMAGVDRAIAEGRTEGFVKLIAAPGRFLGTRAGGQLVGVSLAMPHAGEVVHELSLAMRLRIPPAAVALATHAYPTWAVAVQQAASGFFVDLDHGTLRPAKGSNLVYEVLSARG